MQQSPVRKNAKQSPVRKNAKQLASCKAVALSSSTPRKASIEKLKEITCVTTLETILETFQNQQDMTPPEWEKLADPVLNRGEQKSAVEIFTSRDTASEGCDTSRPNTLPGFLDESGQEGAEASPAVRRSGRQNKNQGPKRYWDPIKHSVKLICSGEDITDLSKAALEAYRTNLATLFNQTVKPVEKWFGHLERHLFRSRYGSRFCIFKLMHEKTKRSV